ncbi:hypothetical protein EMPS_10916 [Entomortierella parvispora]|uniref:GATA-type domain-containing protein n=1 Tax=Entomortierella parvispora TaxID=205924 RepID=A0A9P3HLS9_9FUNG|nr:hypothetical protein EMPS_10916 [Entomortierella parvispora]
MFAAHASPSVASASSWLDDSDMLLSNQDVLDYTSFSDDSHSPVLSIESFASQQHSPDLGAYCFQDFGPLSPSAPAVQDQTPAQAFPRLNNVQLPTTLSEETSRQAALLHAYLAAQNEAYNQQQEQQRWDFAAAARLEQEKKQQEQEKIRAQQTEQQEKQSVLAKTQQADAESLARYLAQIQQVKNEEPQSQENMECADALSDSVDSPSSPSSPSSTSSVMGERSPSPEVNAESKNNGPKSNRQLICFNCNVTQTPLWRRTPDRKHSLCNACGLYYKQYGAHRPLNVRHKLPTVLAEARLNALPYARPSNQGTRASSPSSAQDSSASSDSDSDVSPVLKSLPDLTKMYSEALLRPPAQKTTPPLMTAKQGIECANCSQTQTPLWRKNDAGEPICNACGLYAKLHHRDRPVTMRKSKITRRRRDWGGNLAHQAQAQAQALAFVHAQVQAQVQAQEQAKSAAPRDQDASSVETSMVEEMSRRAQELQGAPTPSSPHSSDSEDDDQQQQKQQQQSTAAQPAVSVAQKLSGNLIMDEHKFSDMVGQMNAHQMNRFLSILESRCGVLRNRLLASTETNAQSNFDHLF